MGRFERGKKLAQIVIMVKDVVGAVADVNKIIANLKVDVRQSAAYPVPGSSHAIYNAFVALKDPEGSLDQLVEKVKQSPFVLEVHGFEGREGTVVDAFSFPVNWQGRKIVIMAQRAMARMFENIDTTFGSGGGVILYQEGSAYGKDLAEFFVGMLGKDYLLRNLDYGLKALISTGWGIPELEQPLQAFPNLTVRMTSCFECDGRSSTGKTCNFMRGVLVGIFSTISGHPVHCEESSCSSRGDSYCQFEVRKAKDQLSR